MRLHVRAWPAQGHELATIVLLHGMGGTANLWRPIAAGLEDRFRVLALDQRGHGKSLGKSPGMSPGNSPEDASARPEDFGRDIAETLADLRVGRAVIVGHSMGVRSACALYHVAPELVTGMVLIDIGFSGPAGGGMGKALETFFAHVPARFETRAEARSFAESKTPDPSMAQYLMAALEPHPDGGFRFPFDQPTLLKTLEGAAASDVSSYLAKAGENGIPVLILRGAESGVWKRDDFLKEQKRFAVYPSIVFEEVPGAGHGLPFEVREVFVKRLRAFAEAAVGRTA